MKNDQGKYQGRFLVCFTYLEEVQQTIPLNARILDMFHEFN